MLVMRGDVTEEDKRRPDGKFPSKFRAKSVSLAPFPPRPSLKTFFGDIFLLLHTQNGKLADREEIFSEFHNLNYNHRLHLLIWRPLNQ